MTKRWKSRARRRKLKAHDGGQNRHHKGMGWEMKQERLRAERNSRNIQIDRALPKQGVVVR